MIPVHYNSEQIIRQTTVYAKDYHLVSATKSVHQLVTRVQGKPNAHRYPRKPKRDGSNTVAPSFARCYPGIPYTTCPGSWVHDMWPSELVISLHHMQRGELAASDTNEYSTIVAMGRQSDCRNSSIIMCACYSGFPRKYPYFPQPQPYPHISDRP